MNEDPDDTEPEDDFLDPDEWLDTDWPIDDPKEAERIEKLRRLRNPPATIIRVFRSPGPPLELEPNYLASALEIVEDGAEHVVRLKKYPDVVAWRGQGRIELIDQSHLGRQPVQPTLIRYPSGDPILGVVEQVIPGSVDDYTIDTNGEIWMVTANPNGHRIYSGPGPVEVVRSQAPF